MHDVEVGVAHLARTGDQFDKMVAALAVEGTGRGGCWRIRGRWRS